MPRARRSLDKPLVRRDADGGKRTAPSWETLIERLIREAQEDGRFDDLPGQGQPLRLEDDVYAGEMATAYRVLRNAGAAPPWIETDKDVRALQAKIDELFDRARRASPLMAGGLRSELETLADAHDDAVRRLESLAPTSRQQRPRSDREAFRARLAAVLEAGSDTP